MIRAHTEKDSVAIELTPLIDMVFLLLIFFLVATTFHRDEREMRVALPQAANAGPISATLREIIVNVDEQGQIIVSGRVIQPAALGQLIEEAARMNPDQKVTVRGDKSVAYQNIIRVLDICKGAGIQEPYLDTVVR